MATGGLNNRCWLQALEESIGQEKSRSEETLEKVQSQVRELESHLACQKEVRPAGGGWLKGLWETEGRWGEGACPSLGSATGRSIEDFKESHGNL